MKQLYDIWFSYIMGVNNSNAWQIADSGFGPRLFYNCRQALSQFNLFTQRQMELAAATAIEDVEGIHRLHLANNIKSVNYTDAEYPVRFRNIHNRPLVLFYKGDLSLLDAQYTVGIVGSRHCSSEGEKACRLIATDVAAGGAVVVSGLAQGVDSVAHRSAVEAGGRTVAFLGTPLNEYFPRTNREFQDRLSAEQLVVSEYYATFPYYSANFIYRNRLIAAAGDALCVVQAKKKSGSLATVNRAVEYDRPVFTVPGSIFSPGFSGTNSLLVQGVAHAVTDGRQILEYLGAETPPPAEEKEPDYSALDETALAVLKVIDGAMNANLIIRASGLKANVVKATLTSLEIDGWVNRTDTGEYIRTKQAN
ncbi:MAG: DNA-processing protein DprA [Oscillospiraceae bacterium]|nr:DNA-processing protein DprA [Oscillospiraceae bacterium]